MDEVDLSGGYVVIDHVAQGVFEKGTAGGALIVAENFHRDRGGFGADGFHWRRKRFGGGRLCMRFGADGLGLRVADGCEDR